MIQIVFNDGLACPTIHCDVCDKPIDPKPVDFSPAEYQAIFETGPVDEDAEFETHMERQVGRENYRAGEAGINALPAHQVVSALEASGVDVYGIDDEEGERLLVRIGQDAQKGFAEADRVTGHESVGEALAKIKVLTARPEYATSRSGDRLFEDVRLLHRRAFDR